MNYLGFPRVTTKHVHLFCTPWDLEHRRAIVPADVDFPLTLTTVQDMVSVVVAAVDYEGVWPERGGITGTTLMHSEFLKLAKSVRGKGAPSGGGFSWHFDVFVANPAFLVIGSLSVEEVPKAQLEDASFHTSWLPPADHPAISPELKTAFAKEIVAAVLLAAAKGAFGVSDEWNQLLPALQMTQAESFLLDVWSEKP